MLRRWAAQKNQRSTGGTLTKYVVGSTKRIRRVRLIELTGKEVVMKEVRQEVRSLSRSQEKANKKNREKRQRRLNKKAIGGGY